MNTNSTILGVGLAVLLVTATFPSGMVGTAAARPAGSGQYTVMQGNQCWEVSPWEPGDRNPVVPSQRIRPHVEIISRAAEFGSTINDSWDHSPTIESVMDYRYRDPAGGVHDNGQDWGSNPHYSPWLSKPYWKDPWSYMTYGLYNWTANHESHMFFYRGPKGVSLVMRHDRPYDSLGIGSHGPYNGIHQDATRDGFMEPLGSHNGKDATTFIFHDLPRGEWAYMDDLYPENMDDIYYKGADFNPNGHTRYGTLHNDYNAVPLENFHGGDFTAHWVWGPSRTGGGAYRGLQHLDRGDSVVIEPYFNQRSWFWSTHPWHYNASKDKITDWMIRRKGAENVHLNMTENVVIKKGAWCPDASFRMGTGAGGNPPSVEVGDQMTLDARRSSGANIKYSWDLDGDGSYEIRNATDSTLRYSYDGNVTGDVSVGLKVTDSRGIVDTMTRRLEVGKRKPPSASVNVSGANENSFASHDVVGERLTFDARDSSDNVALNRSSAVWRVDGNVTARGQMAYAQSFDEPGKHTVSFTVSDLIGLNDTQTVTVNVEGRDNATPTAKADVSPRTVEAGANVTFDGSASTDNRGIESYRWNIDGDGAVESRKPTFEFGGYGGENRYNVTLQVEDANGNTDTATVPVSVLARERPNVTNVSVPRVVTTGVPFDLRASATDNGRITGYRWRIGGETVATGKRATHTFTDHLPAKRGYALHLVVTDAAGTTRTVTRNVTVLPRDNIPPNASLAVSDNDTRVGKEVTFNASASVDRKHHDIAVYHWDFDGVNGTDRTTRKPVVTHTYDSTGEYNASVVVEDLSGNKGFAGVNVTVDPERKAHRGGGGSSTDTGPLPVLTKTDRTGPNSATVDVKNGRKDAKIRATLPASEVSNRTGVRFRNVKVELGGHDAHTVLQTAASASPPGGAGELSAADETLAYFDLGAKYLDAPVRSATVDIAVDGSAVGDHVAPEDIAVYRYDGTWTRVNATVREAGDAYRVSAEAGDLSTLAVGVNHPLSVTDAALGNDSVPRDGSVTASATVENTAKTAREVSLNLTLDGTTVTSKTVEVPAGGATEVSLTAGAPSPGSYDVRVAGVSAGTLDVRETQQQQTQQTGPANLSVSDVSLNRTTIAAGGSVRITAAVENTGGTSGERTVSLTMFGEQVASRQVTVPAGETEQVTFVREVDAAGNYTVKVGGETASLGVTKAEQGGDGDGNAVPRVPGFGVGVTLVALLAAALLARAKN